MRMRKTDAQIIVTDGVAKWEGGRFAPLDLVMLLHAAKDYTYKNQHDLLEVYGLKIRIVSQIAGRSPEFLTWVVMQDGWQARFQSLIWRVVRWYESTILSFEAGLLTRLNLIESGDLFPKWSLSHQLLRFYFL